MGSLSRSTLTTVVAAGLCGLGGVSAHAATILFTNSSLPGAENIMFTASDVGTTVSGATSLSDIGVTFSSTQTLDQKSSGMALLSNDGRGALNNVTVTTAPGYGFTGFTVDLIDPIHHTVDVTVTTNTGTYSDSFTGQGGSNFVSVLASAGETISSINFSGTNGGWEQFKQPQIQMPKPGFAPDPIPEPSTWAMMLLGFAGLGFTGYRASRKAASIAA